jgi:RsiW-degrading membrane proteinase PrsW (M82 family)
MVALILLIIIGVFMGLDPGRLAAIQSLAGQLQNITSQEQAITLLAPIFSNPLTLVVGLFFLSLVTPLAEEIAKSLPVWLGWRQLTSPAQGFALGALSGAGFGLMEGLFVSITPGETWGATLAVRAASSSMHIITAGLVGWGIGKAAQQKRVLPALGGYALGITIHGIWNACVVVMVYASGRTVLSGASPDMVTVLFAVLALCFLGLLILAAPIALWVINHQLQKSLLQSFDGAAKSD